MREAHAVVQREPRREAPRVLRVAFGQPVPDVVVDPDVALVVVGEHAEQRVGVAVPHAQRVVAAVAEVVGARVVLRARLGLAVALGREPELEAVPAADHRQVVGQREPVVLVPPRLRPARAARPDVAHVGQVAAAEQRVREVRILIRVRVVQVRFAGGAKRREARRVGHDLAGVRARVEQRVGRAPIPVGVVARLDGAFLALEAPVILREAGRELVHDGRLEHLRQRAGEEVAREHVVAAPDARHDVVVGGVVIAVEQPTDAEACLLAEHRVHARDDVLAVVDRREVRRVVARPGLRIRRIDLVVRQREQVEHRPAHRIHVFRVDDVRLRRRSGASVAAQTARARRAVEVRRRAAIRVGDADERRAAELGQHAGRIRRQSRRRRAGRSRARVLRGALAVVSLREVARALQRRRQHVVLHVGRPDVVGVFGRREEEELLLARAAIEAGQNDRAADAEARQVDAEERLVVVLLDAQIVVLVHPVAAAVVPGRALELVGARLGDHDDLAAGHPAVFRRVAAADDVDFRDRVDVRGDVRRAVAPLFADRNAVNRRVLVERVAAVDAQVAARGPVREVARALSVDDARQDLQHAEDVAALDLDGREQVAREVLLERAAGGLHGRDFGRDVDRLGDAARREREFVQVADFTGRQRDVGVDRLEALHVDLDGPGAGRQRDQAEHALLVGRGRPDGAGGRAGGGDGRPRDDADVVDNGAAQRRGLQTLRKRGRRACETEQQNGTARQPCPTTSSHIHTFLSAPSDPSSPAGDIRPP